MLSGTASYNKSFSDSKTVTVALGGQFALSRRFALALSTGYRSEDEAFNAISYSSKGKEFFIAPGFVIFGNMSYGWLQPYVEVSLPVGFLSYNAYTNLGVNQEMHATSLVGVVSPGLNIFLSRKIALTASLGLIKYTSVKEKNAEKGVDAVHVGFTPADLTFGLVFVLGAE